MYYILSIKEIIVFPFVGVLGTHLLDFR